MKFLSCLEKILKYQLVVMTCSKLKEISTMVGENFEISSFEMVENALNHPQWLEKYHLKKIYDGG